MSASPIARQATQSQSIPCKNIIIHDPNQMPENYSSTPGGMVYSTTPGGTRIVYERAFLMNLKNSPISQTPPKNMPSFPVNMLKSSVKNGKINHSATKETNGSATEEVSELFQMEM